MCARHIKSRHFLQRKAVEHDDDITILAGYVKPIMLAGQGNMRVFTNGGAVNFLERPRVILHQIIKFPRHTHNRHISKTAKGSENDVMRFAALSHQIGRRGHSGQHFQSPGIDNC